MYNLIEWFKEFSFLPLWERFLHLPAPLAAGVLVGMGVVIVTGIFLGGNIISCMWNGTNGGQND